MEDPHLKKNIIGTQPNVHRLFREEAPSEPAACDWKTLGAGDPILIFQQLCHDIHNRALCIDRLLLRFYCDSGIVIKANCFGASWNPSARTHTHTHLCCELRRCRQAGTTSNQCNELVRGTDIQSKNITILAKCPNVKVEGVRSTAQAGVTPSSKDREPESERACRPEIGSSLMKTPAARDARDRRDVE